MKQTVLKGGTRKLNFEKFITKRWNNSYDPLTKVDYVKKEGNDDEKINRSKQYSGARQSRALQLYNVRPS